MFTLPELAIGFLFGWVAVRYMEIRVPGGTWGAIAGGTLGAYAGELVTLLLFARNMALVHVVAGILAGVGAIAGIWLLSRLREQPEHAGASTELEEHTRD
jgi:uncharacterized membrane protein YeaQ/YmgE (transglycosylase-associated protein family)